MPATLLFTDLWRNDVPGLNYLIAATFITVALISLVLIGRSPLHRPAEPAS